MESKILAVRDISEYNPIDAYDILFGIIDKDDFFEKSIQEIKFIEDYKIKSHWDDLKYDIFNNNKIYIRGYGRDAKKTDYFLEFYKNLFGNTNIKKDSTNNAQPTKLIAGLTNYAKVNTGTFKEKKLIVNYQVSHLFGKTKNPFLFNCAWNIAYIPKYLDPFTGHESQGQHSSRFKQHFEPLIKEKYKEFIVDYNEEINKLEPKFEEAFKLTKEKFGLTKDEFKRFESDCLSELSKI